MGVWFDGALGIVGMDVYVMVRGQGTGFRCICKGMTSLGEGAVVVADGGVDNKKGD